MSGFTGKVTRPPADLSVVNEAGIVVIDGSAGISSATVYCGCDEAEVEVEAMREYLRLWDAEQAGADVPAEPLPEGYRWDGDTLRLPDGSGIGLDGPDLIVCGTRVPAWAVRLAIGEQDLGGLGTEAFSARCEADDRVKEVDRLRAELKCVTAQRDKLRADFGTQLDRSQLLANLLHAIAQAVGVHSYAGWEGLAEQVKAKITSATRERDAAVRALREGLDL